MTSGRSQVAGQPSSSGNPASPARELQRSSSTESADSDASAAAAPVAASTYRRFVLPTILESSVGSSSGSGRSHVSSEYVRTMPGSPRSSAGPSEFGFDILDLPDIVEAPASTAEARQSGSTTVTTDPSGRTVVRVVVPEEVRVLKDSAKEVHEEGGIKKADADDAEPLSAKPEVTALARLSNMIRVSLTMHVADATACLQDWAYGFAAASAP